MSNYIVINSDSDDIVKSEPVSYSKKFKEDASGEYYWIRIVNEHTSKLKEVLKESRSYTNYYPTTKAIMCLFVVYCEIPPTYFKEWQDAGLIVDIHMHVENEDLDDDDKPLEANKDDKPLDKNDKSPDDDDDKSPDVDKSQNDKSKDDDELTDLNENKSASDDEHTDDDSTPNDERYGTIIVQFNTTDIDIKAAEKDFTYSELHFFIVDSLK